MTSPPLPPRRSPVPALLAFALVALLAFASYSWWRHDQRLARYEQQLERTHAVLTEVLGEVTRMRIEQSAAGKGPEALLEKLHVYAPLLSNARVTEPDYQNAKKEMAAIVRAFTTIGKDAWKPVTDRLATLDPQDDFDEIKWLMTAAIEIDEAAGKEIVKNVLLGQRLPYPRLRWFAAQLLTGHDKPLAQQLLRRILLTESSRGVNPERAAKYNMTIPDQAAYATTGFHNFVVAYIRTDDPEIEDTLLMLLGRVEHDTITIQECVEELGRRKCQRAVAAIERLYQDPPLQQQNPLFLNRCLDALVAIQGTAARPFLEQVLPTAPTDTVANQIEFLLNKIK